MKHSQPHIILYRAVIFLSCGGDMLCNIESLMMMFSSDYFSSFSTPSSGGINMILCSSLTDTWNNNFETNCGPFFFIHR